MIIVGVQSRIMQATSLHEASVLEKHIWNEAIEAAAKELDIINDLGGSFLVRKLKK